MNAFAQAQRAYAPTQAPIKTARSAEYEVIARISHRMKRAMQLDDFPALAEALHENNKLWTTLAVDVAHPDNQLPKDLKARILYLSEFTRQHAGKVMQKRENAMPLLEINAAILKGLKQGVSSK